MSQYDKILNQKLQQLGINRQDYDDYVFVYSMLRRANGKPSEGGGPPEYGGVWGLLFSPEQKENYLKVAEKLNGPIEVDTSIHQKRNLQQRLQQTL